MTGIHTANEKVYSYVGPGCEEEYDLLFTYDRKIMCVTRRHLLACFRQKQAAVD